MTDPDIILTKKQSTELFSNTVEKFYDSLADSPTGKNVLKILKNNLTTVQSVALNFVSPGKMAAKQLMENITAVHPHYFDHCTPAQVEMAVKSSVLDWMNNNLDESKLSTALHKSPKEQAALYQTYAKSLKIPNNDSAAIAHSLQRYVSMYIDNYQGDLLYDASAIPAFTKGRTPIVSAYQAGQFDVIQKKLFPELDSKANINPEDLTKIGVSATNYKRRGYTNAPADLEQKIRSFDTNNDVQLDDKEIGNLAQTLKQQGVTQVKVNQVADKGDSWSQESSSLDISYRDGSVYHLPVFLATQVKSKIIR